MGSAAVPGTVGGEQAGMAGPGAGVWTGAAGAGVGGMTWAGEARSAVGEAAVSAGEEVAAAAVAPAVWPPSPGCAGNCASTLTLRGFVRLS